MKYFFFGLIVVLLTSSGNQAPTGEISLNELKQLYKDYYLSSHIDSMPWRPGKKCDGGTLAAEIYQKAENRINFFRLVNHLPTIKIIAEKQKESQAAAYMMKVNNYLSHNPPTSWKCYSKEGAEGASRSCLGVSNYKYYPDNSFVTGFITDPGETNFFAGHRRWLLYSKAAAFSYGATDVSEAIYTNLNFTDSASVDYIAYPWNGYVPINLVFSKWSFSIPEHKKVDFSAATISVTDAKGTPLSLKKYPLKPDYLDHSLTWKMTSMFSSDEEDYLGNKLVEKGFIGKELKVKISNVIVNGKKKTYQYSVKIVNL